MSNSEWTGVRLRDVLQHAGVDVSDPGSAGIEHVQFEGEACCCTAKRPRTYMRLCAGFVDLFPSPVASGQQHRSPLPFRCPAYRWV